MAFTILDTLAGAVDLYNVDPLGPGPLIGLANGPTSKGYANYPGMELRGFDANLGGASFVFAKASAAVTAGAFSEVTVTATATNRYDMVAAPWAGTANSARTLGVAMVTLAAGQFGWFQVQGIAITTVQGAPANGNSVYWQAAGVVSPTVVASKMAFGATFASAVSASIGTGTSAVVLSATQALVMLNWPNAQGAIT